MSEPSSGCQGLVPWRWAAGEVRQKMAFAAGREGASLGYGPPGRRLPGSCFAATGMPSRSAGGLPKASPSSSAGLPSAGAQRRLVLGAPPPALQSRQRVRTSQPLPQARPARADRDGASNEEGRGIRGPDRCRHGSGRPCQIAGGLHAPTLLGSLHALRGVSKRSSARAYRDGRRPSASASARRRNARPDGWSS